uniref:Uncharacterized protein n=1 Tax=Pan troglodytes TaxID=9598 RepID=G2HJL4_PANTR|nr:hypothetical protein [Pan troglodytes]
MSCGEAAEHASVFGRLSAESTYSQLLQAIKHLGSIVSERMTGTINSTFPTKYGHNDDLDKNRLSGVNTDCSELKRK